MGSRRSTSPAKGIRYEPINYDCEGLHPTLKMLSCYFEIEISVLIGTIEISILIGILRHPTLYDRASQIGNCCFRVFKLF